MRMFGSSERRNGDTEDGTFNAVSTEDLRIVVDSRLGPGGCIDPATETRYTGTATNWIATGRPGENGVQTIEVGHLAGTGRAPQSRSFNLSQGQWGVGWDIKHDIGAKFLDRMGMQKNDGA